MPATGSEPRASQAGNDSLLAAFDGGVEEQRVDEDKS